MSALRVLHVNTSDLEGGAARAAHRIHRALRASGVDSHMLVVNRREPAMEVLQPLKPAQRAFHRARLEASDRIMARQITPTNPVLHSLNLFSSGLARWINRSDFDVVNLHWVCGEMLSVGEIGEIGKPLVWTMHDMWPIAGAEHYDDLDHPGRYRGDYTAGNRPSNYRGPDLDAWTWRRKRKAWAEQRFRLVSPSHWLAGCAAESALMRGQACQVIANCIDENVFKPIDRDLARRLLNLPNEKRFILFGAMSSTSDSRKGFHLLQPALQRLAAQAGVAGNTELLVFGAQAPRHPPDFGLPARYLGSFHDEVSLALLYNAANVFVLPSMQDNLPNTMVEALACGTPCAGFRIGGIPDLTQHRSNGWLASPFDPADLAAGISFLLDNDLRGGLRSLLPDKTCDEASVAARYLVLYQQALR